METTLESPQPVDLTVGEIISQGFKIGMRNAVQLIAAVILWILTIWIPYINVGTTIGIISIVVAMSKGKAISPLEIFDSKYRRYMGEFFLLLGFLYAGLTLGLLFVVIPGIVIAIAWSQAIYLLIDREMNPIEAIRVSNKITYGHKWTIFLGIFVLALLILIVDLAVTFLGAQVAEWFGAFLSFVVSVLFAPIILGGYAHIYSTLSKRV